MENQLPRPPETTADEKTLSMENNNHRKTTAAEKTQPMENHSPVEKLHSRQETTARWTTTTDGKPQPTGRHRNHHKANGPVAFHRHCINFGPLWELRSIQYNVLGPEMP